MKFLVVNTDYPAFLRWLYEKNGELEKRSYEDQMEARVASLNSEADFYSRNLRKLGQEAWDIYANNEFLQKAWAKERGIRFRRNGSTELAKTVLWRTYQTAGKTALRHFKPLLRPMLGLLDSHPSWFYDIFATQIKFYRPDVLFNQAMHGISSRFLKEMKSNVRLLVGQIASPLPKGEDFSCYDLVISSLPSFVEYFRQIGIPAELNRLAFEPGILANLNSGGKKISVSFVGSLSQHHQARVRLLEHLCARLDIKIWGQGVENLAKNSAIRHHHMGAAWGIEMYQILQNSKITLNHHIGVAASHANNMRLFEATGVGTLLITDWKKNVNELFEPGKEVVAYRSAEECAELIEYYLGHEDEREAIARAGQRRTLTEHTYYHRMQKLIEILERYLA